MSSLHTKHFCPKPQNIGTVLWVLQLQMIKAIIDSRRFKGSSSDESRRVQVLDLYCLTRFESEGSRRGVEQDPSACILWDADCLFECAAGFCLSEELTILKATLPVVPSDKWKGSFSFHRIAWWTFEGTYSGSQNCPNVLWFWTKVLGVKWWHNQGSWNLCQTN